MNVTVSVDGSIGVVQVVDCCSGHTSRPFSSVTTYRKFASPLGFPGGDHVMFALGLTELELVSIVTFGSPWSDGAPAGVSARDSSLVGGGSWLFSSVNRLWAVTVNV